MKFKSFSNFTLETNNVTRHLISLSDSKLNKRKYQTINLIMKFAN